MNEHNNTPNKLSTKDGNKININGTQKDGNKMIDFKNFGHFSFFERPVKNVNPLKTINLKDVYDLIISDAYKANTNTLRSIHDNKKYGAYKASNFDYVTFNGTFSQRADSKLKSASSLFIIDIDHLGDKLELVRERIIQDKILQPQLVFISPSKDGLKIVVGIDSTLINHSLKSKTMEFIWQPINTYFATEYSDLITSTANTDYIDRSGKDISRACFLCHDPLVFLNVNEGHILGQDFIDSMSKIEQKNKTRLKSRAIRNLRVNPSTTIEILANRHLLESDNHHPDLISFAGACKTAAFPIDKTLRYLKNKAHFSDQSNHSDFEKVKTAVVDIYKRYSTNSKGIKYLTPLTFGYGILYFKYSKDAKQFIASSLYLDEIRNALHEAGFAKRKIGNGFLFIQHNGCIIKEVTPEIMRSYFTDKITSMKEGYSINYKDEQYDIPPETIREIYFKNSNNIFNAAWLEHLQIHDEPILKDTENESYIFFQNSLVTISKGEIKTQTWDNKSGFCIWEDHIIKRDFEYIETNMGSHFYKFIRNVTDNDNSRFRTMVSGIGYLLHHHFRESEGQAVVFYDQTITDTKTPMGGSGKGLIMNAIKQVKKVSKIDGKHFDTGNRFRWEQISPSTQVVWLDDVKSDFDFSTLHSNLTDGWTIERKHQMQFLIDSKDSPKTAICSNSIIKGGGSTNKRRQFIIELSDFYSRQIIRGDEKPIEQTHGCLFFSETEWTSQEWNLFYSFMIDSCYQYMNNGLIPFVGINIELNRFRQATDSDFAAWVIEQNFEKHHPYETKIYHQLYLAAYYGDIHPIGQRAFSGFLKSYSEYKGWSFKVHQSNGLSYFQFT